MSYQLNFAIPFKSIVSFDGVELPSFVILTGENGSGKSHFLQAIQQGKITSTLTTDIKKDVRLFDWASIVPAERSAYDPREFQAQRSSPFTNLSNVRQRFFDGLQSKLISRGVPPELCVSLEKLCRLQRIDLDEFVEGIDRRDHIWSVIDEEIKNTTIDVANSSIQQFPDGPIRRAATVLYKTDPRAYLMLDQKNFSPSDEFLWGEIDPFQQEFSQTFSIYRSLLQENALLQSFPSKGDGVRKYLEPEDFVEKYGEPPWDFVNHILQICLLDFEIDHPVLNETGAYGARLRKISANSDLSFGDLSSGEKVLMSFALCLYNAQESRQAKVFPKLLMLDEIDAPLHPSMVLSLLNIIQNVLVDERKVSVIMTTHSPSTVALAPDESIFVMEHSSARVKKIAKSEALAILTTGVPTLSVSFDGRRQVFVESHSDAKLYDALYQLYKGEIASERSLIFIAVGYKSSKGLEQNAGREQVERFVEGLVSNGNPSVFGLIDWDGKNSSITRLHVLSPGLRNGIENLLLDPVLLLAVSVKQSFRTASDLDLVSKSENYLSVLSWTQEQWQQGIDQLQRKVLGDVMGDTLEIRYLNGMTLNVQKAYLHMDDHALSDLVMQKLPFLSSLRQKGGVMQYCVHELLPDCPKLMPADLVETFKGILDFPT
ncbi:AAA family ATPase [Herbaspirillum robiniae]|uniref:AAA family ATPase n=1 Tax=Herbaspirillum robiniae TaxID=2014887 RepID=UPI0009A23D9B|nr:AAA family ATPase [Herbaspirillum robiniae]